MATRNATAQWNGGLKGGNGQMAAGSGAFDTPFTFRSRFETGPETNPEELIGAALAGCYSMQLSAMLEKDGATPESVRTEAEVTLRADDSGPHISRIDLATRARVPGIDDGAFQQTVAAAKEACLIHRALAGVGEITVQAQLEG
jgi:osmotically inducible protein OsmC